MLQRIPQENGGGNHRMRENTANHLSDKGLVGLTVGLLRGLTVEPMHPQSLDSRRL